MMFILFRNMNLMTFVVLLCCSHAYSHKIRLSNKPFIDLSSAVAKLKDIMRTGNDSLGIPVLDPLIAAKVPINFDEKEFRVNATLEDVEVYGLSDFNLIKGDLNIGKVQLVLNLSWPLVIANTEYDLEAEADMFKIYGKGSIEATVRDFVFELDISFSLKDGYLSVKEVASGLSLRKLDFRATGLFDDEELSEIMSAVISDIAPDLIDDYQEQITKELNLLITKILDDFLAKHSMSEILKWIMG